MSDPNMREYFANYGLVWFLENRIFLTIAEVEHPKITWNPKQMGVADGVMMNFSGQDSGLHKMGFISVFLVQSRWE